MYVPISYPKYAGQEIHTPSIYINNETNNLVNENTNSFLNVVPVSSEFEKIFISRLHPETTEMQIRDYTFQKRLAKYRLEFLNVKLSIQITHAFAYLFQKIAFVFYLDKSLWPAKMVLRPFYSSRNSVQIQNCTHSADVKRDTDNYNDIDNASLMSKSVRHELNIPIS